MVQATRLPVPGPVVVVVLAVVLSAALDFEGRGIAVVGDIPAGLPSLAIPTLSALPMRELLLGAAAVFLVSFGAGIITARSFGARGNYRVDPNGELVGFGAANIASGLFGGFPITASDSRTAVNMAVGGKTQVASLVSAAALIATLLYLNGALRILPIPALGAILAAAALSLIDFDSLRQIWRISRMEFAFALIAMWGAISLGALEGVMIAVAATFAYVLSKKMFPRDAMLGRIPGRAGFYKLHRSPEARPVPGLAVCLIEGSLLFFSVDHVKERLAAIADDLPPDTRWFVIDASAIAQVDSTAAAMLEEFRADLARRGIALGFAELHAEVRALLERAGLLARIGPSMIFQDLEEAMRAFRPTRDGRTAVGSDPSSQNCHSSQDSRCRPREDHGQERRRPRTPTAGQEAKKARNRATKRPRPPPGRARASAGLGEGSGRADRDHLRGPRRRRQGGMIKRITERVSPRVFRVVALPAPTEREKSQLYIQRYFAHLPAAGEIVIFDRSWYNRAGRRAGHGLLLRGGRAPFLKLTPRVEAHLVESPASSC